MIRQLKESERQKAYEVARSWTAGKEPKLDTSGVSLSEYHPRVIQIVLTLCIILLIAAFIPSALRLHKAGSEEFCQTDNQNLDVCNVVGLSTVLLAETGSLVFILALSVVKTGTKIKLGKFEFSAVQGLLWLSAFTSVLVAIVGNAHIGQPWKHGQIFDYLIVFVPPALVLTVGYILKDFLLELLRTRRERNRIYNEKLFLWKATLDEPELNPRWLRYYSKALKESIQSANRNKTEELETLSRDDWEKLILHEMTESVWEIDPNKVQKAIDPVQTKDEWSLDDLKANGFIWQNDSGLWSAILPGTETEIGNAYQTDTTAKRAILIRLYHQNKKENQSV